MSTKLKENQLLATPLVAQGVSGKEIAKQLWVAEETVSRWRQLPEFQARVNSILMECREDTQQQLRHIIGLSLTIIQEELQNTNSSTRVSLALKLVNSMKLTGLLYEEIGSNDVKIIAKRKESEDFKGLFL